MGTLPVPTVIGFSPCRLQRSVEPSGGPQLGGMMVRAGRFNPG
ncbi:hypothetical protein L083_4602 [Actinoplanes sp. N902-109]|nr:hypothetical protein L083_4602 [Actinoplanes sp. N902-109]